MMTAGSWRVAGFIWHATTPSATQRRTRHAIHQWGRTPVASTRAQRGGCVKPLLFFDLSIGFWSNTQGSRAGGYSSGMEAL
jgi:hypothetical protein